MKRRRHLTARLDRMSPPPVRGGVLYIEDLKSGAVRFEDLPTRGGGGYLLVSRPCQTAKEWAQKYQHVQHASRKESL